MSFGGAWSSILALAALAEPPAQKDASSADEIVVTGKRIPPADELTVTARRIPHCHRRPGDPADAVHVPAAYTAQRVIAPDKKTNQLSWQIDREQMSGPDVWQRAGTGIGQYVFRVPEDGSPMCIGAAVDWPSGWGQLRQIVAIPEGHAGKYLHFSALVAARDAALIRFWLGGFANRGFRGQGGDTSADPLTGTFGWKRVDLVAGPIPYEAGHASYGFLLWGKGDVWLYEPKLEIQTRDQVKNVLVLPLSGRRHPFEIR